MNQRMREGNVLAETLVGLGVDEGSAAVVERGFHPEVIPPGRLVAAALGSGQVVFEAEESGRVTRAWGG